MGSARARYTIKAWVIMQSAKIIDVTQTFIPVNPNAFPETLHGTQKEDFPEQRFPVVPYKGHNFLPTSYGYRSYFGTNAELQIESLLPNKPDHIFMFQSLTYRNILVALCDTGIWYKNSSEAGPWAQAVALPAPGEFAFYEWYTAIIKNKLYVFRNNNEGYYVIESDPLAAEGVRLETKVPTFITIAEQLGMSRLGSRLVFWDANNAIAWSSPDDVNDFTPAILTGANVTTFNSILGRIASILPHGKHAIAYASKSLVLLQVEPGETFLVRAVPIMTNCGVPYQRQIVISVPDTIHFCYTDTGIFKIDAGKPEQIVPEFYDYLKPYNAQPVYLKMLQGRYLCFEMLDPNALDGDAQFSKTVIPESSLLFSAIPETLEEVHQGTVNDVDMCTVIAGLTKDAFKEQKDAANTEVPSWLRKPGTDAQPVYTCYLSLANGPENPIVWSETPCGGQVGIKTGQIIKPAPNGDGGKISSLTTDATNKTAKTGAESWIDGHWTMERFVQYQTAIWQAQEKAIKAFITELKGFAVFESLTSQAVQNCVAASPTPSDCTIGRYATAFSAPEFGFNACSFWLTRYVLTAEDIINRYTLNTICVNNNDPLPVSAWQVMFQGGTFDGVDYSSEEACLAVIQATYPAYSWYLEAVEGGNINTAGAGTALATTGAVHRITHAEDQAWNFATRAFYRAAPNKIVTQNAINPYPALPTMGTQYASGYSDRTDLQGSSNRGAPVDAPAPLGVETAYCELTGYEYIDKNGNKQIKPVTSGCQINSDSYPQSQSQTRVVPYNANRDNLLNGDDGSICGIPFDLLNEDLLLPPVEWTDITVTYPRSEFLVQQGSIAPKYPTIYGAFVYDLALKKWGKMKGEYKQLLDYSPINSGAGAPIGFDTFGILAGLIKENGYVYLFDNAPTDSEITWGKIGYYRLGVTEPHEVRVDFASSSSGTVTVEASLDGTSLTDGWATSKAFSGRTVVVNPEYSGKWHNVTVSGRYDITHLQFRGEVKGRR